MWCFWPSLRVKLRESSSRYAVEAKVNADGVQRKGLDCLGEGRSALDYLALRPGSPCCPTRAREGSHIGTDISPCFSSCSSCHSLPSWGQIWSVPSTRGPTCVSHCQVTSCPLHQVPSSLSCCGCFWDWCQCLVHCVAKPPPYPLSSLVLH